MIEKFFTNRKRLEKLLIIYMLNIINGEQII